MTYSIIIPTLWILNNGKMASHKQRKFLCEHQTNILTNIFNQTDGRHILTFTSLDSKQENKRFWTEWRRTLPEFHFLLISSWIKFRFVIVFPKYFNWTTYSNDLVAGYMSRFWFAFWWRDRNIYLLFSMFLSGPTSLLASIKFLCFSLSYLCYLPVDY
jgi:hypothetical protein